MFMPSYIMRLIDPIDNKEYFMEWSTVVDAPITYGLSLEEFTEYYKGKYGTEGLRILPERIARTLQKGISAHPPFDDYDSYFRFNRADDIGDKTLDFIGVLDRYCRNRPQNYIEA